MWNEIEALKDVISPLQETPPPRKQQLIKLKSTASLSASSSFSSSIESGFIKPNVAPPIRKASTESIKSMTTTTKLNEKFAKKTKMRRHGSRYFVDDDKFENKIDDKKDNEYSSSSSSVMSEGI